MKTIIANPPFSANWDANTDLLQDPRFSDYGKLAPKSKADFAFIQDMIHYLDNDGIMSVVLPHGVLFRGSSEGSIRRYLIEKMNVLDAVIGLPQNIFFGTSIPTCVLIFKKNRSDTDDVVFIDASRDFEKAKNKNILTTDSMRRISDTYHFRKSIEKYSHLSSLKEIEDNDYNLNIPRYVDVFEEEEEIDIGETMSEINRLKKESIDQERQLNVYLKELGLPLFDINEPTIRNKLKQKDTESKPQLRLFS